MTKAVTRKLDRCGDAVIPDGYMLITSEREFLRHALDDACLMVRGETLCRWAEAFFRARSMKFETEISPTDELRNACPLLTQDQAAQLYTALGVGYQQICKPIRCLDILQVLYANGPWQEQPTPFHAASWLLWLDNMPVPAYVAPLLEMQVQNWQQCSMETHEAVYAAYRPEQAEQFLYEWLGITNRNKLHLLGEFPADVPDKWMQRARTYWTQQVIADEGAFFEDMQASPVPNTLRRLASAIAFDYYVEHPSHLTPKRVNALSAYLVPNKADKLQSLCAPPVPGPLPETVANILTWFRDEYLPYRKWQARFGDQDACARVRQLASKFAAWCLDYYPGALSGGEGKEHLAINYAARLQASRYDQVTLWVVLDGLHFGDANTLWRLIEQEPRLTRETSDVAIASLPTITDFCKKALLYGSPADKVTNYPLSPNFPGAKDLPEKGDNTKLLKSAEPGDVFVWRVGEPDNTYHKANTVENTLLNVSHELEKWALRILEAAHTVPDKCSLRLVISTDHGRLMVSGERIHPVPNGMTPHGRTVYGETDITFDSTGYLVDQASHIAYLHKSRFRLPFDCAVALDDNVFVTSDGKSGTEHFPHGGLYPEEVLVPWVEFVRDWTPPQILGVLAGKAVARTTGLLHCRIQNPGKIPIHLSSIELNLGEQHSRRLALDVTTPALSAQEYEVPLDQWPSRAQCNGATGMLTFTLPTGSEFTVPLSLEIEAEEMYSSELDADDLFDLGNL